MTFKGNDNTKEYYAVFVPTYDESGNPVEKNYTFEQNGKLEFLKAAFCGAYFTAGGSGDAASVTMLATDASANKCLDDWLYGVSTGTVFVVQGMDSNPDITNNIPIGLTIEQIETDEWINFNDPTMGISGLPKWAKYNLGVDTTDLDAASDWYGDYYQWGDLWPF